MMRKILSFRLGLPVLLVTLACAGALWWPVPAQSLAPLAYSWSCASRACSFTVTTNNHGAYQWNFGDGVITGKSTSRTKSHFYNVPVDEQFHTVTVTLAGYATLSSGSPDNIIACNVVFAASAVGIGTSGTCS